MTIELRIGNLLLRMSFAAMPESFRIHSHLTGVDKTFDMRKWMVSLGIRTHFGEIVRL
jgi:hypothetical protein